MPDKPTGKTSGPPSLRGKKSEKSSTGSVKSKPRSNKGKSKDEDAVSKGQSRRSSTASKGSKKKGKVKGNLPTAKVAPAPSPAEGEGEGEAIILSKESIFGDEGIEYDFDQGNGGKAGNRRIVLNDEEEAATNHYAMYRPLKGHDKNYQLPVLIKFFNRSYPWPPKKQFFLTSGYYGDLASGTGDGQIKGKEIKISNLGNDVTEADIKKQFPGAVKIISNPDDTAIVVMASPAAAENAFEQSTMVKIGRRRLMWLRPDELYVINTPINMNENDLKTDFPTAEELWTQSGPDDGKEKTEVVIVRFKNKNATQTAYDESEFPKLGNQQLKYNLGSNPLNLANLPDDITEEDIQNKFSTATKIMFDKANGLHWLSSVCLVKNARITFATDEEAFSAYDKSDFLKLGRPKLGWKRPDEIYVEDVPDDVTEANLFKEFPTATQISFQFGEGGKRIATVKFKNEEDRKVAMGKTRLKKLDIQRLGWIKGLHIEDTGYDPKAVITVMNLTNGITKSELKKKFPKAKDGKILIDNKNNVATIAYKTLDAANKAYDESGLVQIPGHYALRWIRPNETIVTHVDQSFVDKPEEFQKAEFPKSLKIQFLEDDTDSTHRTAVITYDKVADRKTDHDNSKLKKISPQILRYGYVEEVDKRKGGKLKNTAKNDAAVRELAELDKLTDEQLAQKLFDVNLNVGFSNISNLFTPAIKVIGLPSNKSRKALLDIYPDAKRIDIETTQNRQKIAIIEFNDFRLASQAYAKSRRIIVDGHHLEVQPIKIGAAGTGAKLSNFNLQSQNRKGSERKKSVK